VDITFPKMPCVYLSLDVMDISGAQVGGGSGKEVQIPPCLGQEGNHQAGT
jgi:hypothetical protein